MNRYPFWKNALVFGLILIATILALPNIFGDDMAIQVSSSDGTAFDKTTLTQLTTTLMDKGIEYKSAVLQEKAALLRFPNVTEQLRA